MRKGLILVSLLGWIAGCGGSSKSGSDAGTHTSTDMASTPVATPDLATPADLKQLSCSDLLSDACQADQASFDACVANASTNAKKLLQAFFTCSQNTCANEAGDDAGTSPCSTQHECGVCVQTGVGLSGMKNGNGVCNNGSTDITAPIDPLCGKCVDQILACGNDV